MQPGDRVTIVTREQVIVCTVDSVRENGQQQCECDECTCCEGLTVVVQPTVEHERVDA